MEALPVQLRKLQRIVAIIMAVGIWNLALPLSVAGAVQCGNAGYLNRFDGIRTVSSVYIAQGTLIDRPVALCTPSDGTSGASAWFMIAGGTHEYAQIGYARVAGQSSTATFTEYNDGTDAPPGWSRSFWPGIFVSGHSHSYVVSYSFSTGHISMTVGGVTKATTPWGADTAWSAPFTGQFFGESWDAGDDVPGTSAAKAAFSSLRVKTCRSCSLSNPTPDSGSPYQDLSFMKFQWVTNPTAFNIWTQR
jgi:hypothetical protein